MYPIATGYSTNLFNGQTVKLSNGTIIADNYSAASSPTTAIAGTIGVFVGCQYVNSMSQTIQSQYWPASTVSNYAVGYVIDDPRTVFKAAVTGQGTSLANTANTTIGYVNPAFVGTNMYTLTGNSGSTTNGNSYLALTGGAVSNGTGNTRVTTAAPWRVVGVVPETAVVVSAVASTSGSSTTLTLAAANSSILAGMQVIAAGTGAAQGNYITVTNVNSTTLTVSSAITVASGTTCSFIGFPEVLVTWNGNFHSMNNTTGV
jgi:xanthosine utilization system XapX-like protein